MIRISIAVLALIVVLAGCQKPHEGTVTSAPKIIQGLGVQVVNTSMVDDYREVSGTVRAKDISVLSSRIMGAVTAVHVNEGDHVRRGQLLISLDDRDLKDRSTQAAMAADEAHAALASATRQKELAEATFTRYKALYDGNAISRQEFDNVQTSRAVAENELARARAAVGRIEAAKGEAQVYAGFSRITSPIDGIVTSRMVDPGTMASPGVPIMTVEGGGSYNMEVEVPEALINTVVAGSVATVRIDSIGKDLAAKVTEAVGHVDTMTRTFKVKLALTDPAIRGGMYGHVSFKSGAQSALLVPKAAIVQRGQLTGVYIVGTDGMIAYRLLKAGREYPQGIAITSGLNVGDRVITSGVERAVEGALAR